MQKLRIVHAVESYYPSVGGMQEVVRQLSERLVAMGHEVTLVTSKHPDRNFTTHKGVHIREFEISGNMVEGYKGKTAAYENFLLNELSAFDVISFFAAQQWATDLALPLLDKISIKKVNIPTGYSRLFAPAFKDYFERMKTWVKSYDMNVFLSDDYRDISFVRENGVDKIQLIPNGAGEDEFLSDKSQSIRKKSGIAPDDFLLLHIGSFTFTKGQRVAIEIFLESHLKNATLLLIGKGHEHFYRQLVKKPFLFLRVLINNLFGSKKVIYTYFSREETIDAFKEADLFLFPSMIECSPIVLFESMAAKTPFLVTDVGNAAEIVKWSNGGWIMPTFIDENGLSHSRIKASAKLLDELYSDKIKMKVAAEQGFASWKNKFSWEIIARKYESMYLNLVNGK